jgi:hypothetical protein
MADFTTFSDGTVTQGLADQRGWKLYFMHVPTGKEVVFKAFITQYSESFGSEWETVEAYGRMDPIQTFKKTGRSITIGWDVVAESHDDAKENLQRINMLIKMLYPVYRENYLAAGPVIRFQFANLVSDQGESIICTMNGLDYQPDTEDAGFVDPGSGTLFPKKISLSTELTVLHDHVVGWDTEGNWKHRDDSEGINWPFHTGESGTADTGFASSFMSGVATGMSDTLAASITETAAASAGTTSEALDAESESDDD